MSTDSGVFHIIQPAVKTMLLSSIYLRISLRSLASFGCRLLAGLVAAVFVSSKVVWADTNTGSYAVDWQKSSADSAKWQRIPSEQEQYRNSVVGYGVSKRVVLVSVLTNGTITGAEEERCVFDPIFRRGAQLPNDFRGWSLRSESTEKYPLAHLRGTKVYYVLDKDAQTTDIRFESFELVANAYPNYFVGARVPKGGCGTLLMFTRPKVQSVPTPDGIKKYIAMLEREEPSLFLKAICSKRAAAVMRPAFDAELCKRVSGWQYLANKSKVRQFYAGKDWYLVRSYSAPHALILYKIDFVNDRLVPIPGFISVGDGEQYLALGYMMGVDLDGDGVNEMLVYQAGWEWSGYGYLKKTGESWK